MVCTLHFCFQTKPRGAARAGSPAPTPTSAVTVEVAEQPEEAGEIPEVQLVPSQSLGLRSQRPELMFSPTHFRNQVSFLCTV